MSCQHHGSPEEQAAERRMLEEFLGTAKPSFPAGKLRENDEGELAFAVALDPLNKAVIVRFAKPVDWVGLNKAAALHLATLLTEKAEQLT